MKFTFARYEVRPSKTVPSGIVFRPEILVRLVGPAGELCASALLDTGADESILPKSIAPILGVQLDVNSDSTIQGVTGQQMSLSTGVVDIELFDDDTVLRWKTVVSFADFPNAADECIIFGHAGGLELFTAIFHGEFKHGELIPNDQFYKAISSNSE